LFVPGNEWTGALPVNADTVTPDEFRRMQMTGEAQVVTPATQMAKRTAHARAVEAERDFLESKTDLSAEVTALLAQSHAATNLDGEPVVTLPDGRQMGLVDLGLRIEKAAANYRLAHDPLNALASYELSYGLLSADMQAQVTAPASLHSATLEQIKQAAQQMDVVLHAVIDIDHVRLDPEAPPTPIAAPMSTTPKADRKQSMAVIPGNGVDNSGPCNTVGYARRYWFPLRSFVSPVRDQGERGTCWAFSAVAAVESRERVQNNNAVDISEQFLVNKYKWEWYPSDFTDGGSAAAALNAAADRNQALMPEAGWTYNPARGRPDNAFDKDVEGTLASYAHACDATSYTGTCSESAHEGRGICTKFINGEYCAVANTEFSGPGTNASRVRLLWSNGDEFKLATYRALLASGVSLIASFPVYEGFSTAPAGIVSDYRKMKMEKGKLVEGDYGGHLVQIVGFISNEDLSFAPGGVGSNIGGGGYFIIRNSWGCAGDGGYFYVPADYVSSLFATLEVLDFDARRSAQWNSEQIVPGGGAGLAIDSKGSHGVDLRVQENLASTFTVSHPTANYVRLTVTSDRDGKLYDGQWLVNPPISGSLFANSLPFTFQTEGLRTLTITARYGTQVITATKNILALNSPPTIVFKSSGSPQQNENFVIDAVVTDRNEVNPIAICAAMTWTVTAPDTIVSGSDCTRVIRFGVTGDRQVRVSAHDQEGRDGAAIETFAVLPPPVNPYPRITTFGVYARDYLRVSNQVTGCYTNQVGNNAVLDLRDLGCKLSITGPDVPRYYSQLSIENPSAEVLSYDWTYTDTAGTESRVLTAHTSTANYNMDAFLFGSAGSPGIATYSCTIDVRVNAPESSRSKSLRVWSGQCMNYRTAVR
jgi:C1A family cysteine protease